MYLASFIYFLFQPKMLTTPAHSQLQHRSIQTYILPPKHTTDTNYIAKNHIDYILSTAVT